MNRYTSLFAVTFIDSLNGWAVGKIVLHTSDGGQSWTTQRQATGLIAVSFTDQLNGWATGYDPQTDAIIVHTTDGGMTWSPQFPDQELLRDIKFIDKLHGWTVGLFGRIFYTTDGGYVWREQRSYTSRGLRAIDFIDIHTGWIVGDFGTILHTTTGGISNVKQRSQISILPKRFILYGNYPNPFNAQTKIRFEIFGSRANVRLQIYNLQGHAVAKLIDEHRSTGLHEVSWDGANSKGARCASGLYFYRLEMDGIAQVGKAVLLQ